MAYARPGLQSAAAMSQSYRWAWIVTGLLMTGGNMVIGDSHGL